MNKILRYSFVALLAMVGLNLSAQEVTLDFTLETSEGSKESVWGFPASSKNKTVEEKSFTYGGYTVKVAGSEGQGYYWHDKDHYLLFGKEGAYVTLPAFDFDVASIEVEGNSSASANTKQNIFVGDEAVSTETTGAQGTNTYAIADAYQAAGTIYTIKVTSNHNDQIRTIKIYKKDSAAPIAAPKFSVAGGTYYEPQTVAMTCETEGAKILYTIPAGNDPEYIDDNNYTGVFYDGIPLTITKTTTIKAMAVKDGKTSSIVSATYTIAEIEEINVSKAIEIINALENGKTTTEEYQVKGFVVGTPDFQRKADQSLYGNVNFTIADEKGGTTTLTVFRAKDLENVNFTEETINRIKEGDEVVVQGKLQKYVKNEVVTPELTNGYLISVTAGEDPNPGIDPNATIIEVPVSKFAPWDNCTIEGNVITMGEGWKGGAIYIGADMTQFDYVWIKFKNATGTPNFGITYDEWLKNESWGPSFAATTTAMDGTGMVGIKLDKKTVMVHGNAETDGVGIGDVYAQHVQQVTIQGGSSAASVEVEGIWFGTAEEFVKAGGDVPVRPEAGSSLTMWEGELVYNGWGVSSTVDAKYFEVAEVGDIIYCSVKDVTADYNPLFKNVSDWSDFTDIQATLAKDETHFEGKIATAEALGNLQKNGLRFQGIGFTLTKVELKVSDPSGVNTINAAKIENGAIYNVAGQKVNAGYKGVVIKNGKKFIQK